MCKLFLVFTFFRRNIVPKDNGIRNLMKIDNPTVAIRRASKNCILPKAFCNEFSPKV